VSVIVLSVGRGNLWRSRFNLEAAISFTTRASKSMNLNALEKIMTIQFVHPMSAGKSAWSDRHSANSSLHTLPTLHGKSWHFQALQL
jgi:hypothetical protein